jgi:hypothetical protein
VLDGVGNGVRTGVAEVVTAVWLPVGAVAVTLPPVADSHAPATITAITLTASATGILMDGPLDAVSIYGASPYDRPLEPTGLLDRGQAYSSGLRSIRMTIGGRVSGTTA